jgi:hypothetical protein
VLAENVRYWATRGHWHCCRGPSCVAEAGDGLYSVRREPRLIPHAYESRGIECSGPSLGEAVWDGAREFLGHAASGGVRIEKVGERTRVELNRRDARAFDFVMSDETARPSDPLSGGGQFGAREIAGALNLSFTDPIEHAKSLAFTETGTGTSIKITDGAMVAVLRSLDNFNPKRRYKGNA